MFASLRQTVSALWQNRSKNGTRRAGDPAAITFPFWILYAACLVAFVYSLFTEIWQFGIGGLTLAFVIALSPRFKGEQQIPTPVGDAKATVVPPDAVIKTAPASVAEEVVPPDAVSRQQPSEEADPGQR